MEELQALAVEKAKFDLAKTKLEGEAWLAMIDSGWSLIALTTNGRNNKKIGKTFREDLALAP